ncbi:MAG: outer membrane beta-barrel family protein, partial [Sphingobacteriaceae bacterium]|nr:outer membrane beta-barrel family protein [Sphingobacteriaceae bacterium]
IQADLTYNQVTGRGAGFDTKYTLINAYISRQFFKNKGTFKLSGNDLLDQNTGVERNGGGNTITDLNYNVLKRYYMLSFTYSLGNAAKSTTGGMQGMGGGMRGIRM